MTVVTTNNDFAVFRSRQWKLFKKPGLNVSAQPDHDQTEWVPSIVAVLEVLDGIACAACPR